MNSATANVDNSYGRAIGPSSAVLIDIVLDVYMTTSRPCRPLSLRFWRPFLNLWCHLKTIALLTDIFLLCHDAEISTHYLEETLNWCSILTVRHISSIKEFGKFHGIQLTYELLMADWTNWKYHLFWMGANL